MPQTRPLTGTGSFEKRPPVLGGFNASGFGGTLREYEDGVPDGTVLFAARGSKADAQSARPMRLTLRELLRSKGKPKSRAAAQPEAELSEIPSDIVHLIGKDSRYVEEPPIDDYAVPVDEDLFVAIADVHG